ncbi:MAG TPA: hypothetical protein PLI66_00235, partial [Spirochaetales bacterium]|nr:hypothetical protein [Spirochaetales bacterium]
GDSGFHLSASVAIAVWPDDGTDFKELVEQAYGLMTRAWKDGGDRVYRLGSFEPSPGGPEGRR